MRPRSFPLVAIVLSLVGAAPAEEAPVRVSVVRATRAPTDELHRASGTVRGAQTAVVTSKATGTVREIRVRAGDEVQRGQTLALLDAAAVEANLARARAHERAAAEALDEAEEAIGAATAEARVAEVTFARNRNLLAERAVTRQELDESQARERSARAQVAMARARKARAEAGIAEARAEVQAARAALADTRIVAPFAGRVIERRVDPGSLASPSTPLFLIDRRGPLRVDVPVEESLAGRVRVGDRAEVEVGDGERLEGRVSEVVPSIDPATRAFLVKIELPPSAGRELQPGMFARALFRVGTAERLRVPRSAIVQAGALDRLFVVEEGRARLRLVTLGRAADGDGDEAVEVLSGLDPGELVIVSPPIRLRDGARVESVSADE
jgi:multidrug efflux pump subunit AcrA (membrane-fusion protein)